MLPLVTMKLHIKSVTIVAIIKPVFFFVQVAQIYQSIEFSRLTSLVPFVDAFQLERAIVDAARHCDLQVCAIRRPVRRSLELFLI